jgi:hypothetical protein
LSWSNGDLARNVPRWDPQYDKQQYGKQQYDEQQQANGGTTSGRTGMEHLR